MNADQTIVERAAKAHWESRRRGFSIPRLGINEIMDWSALPDTVRNDECQAMRAAFAAMRDLTDEMMIGGLEGLTTQICADEKRVTPPNDPEGAQAYRQIGIGRRMQDGNGVKACWQGAIDAALAETSKESPVTPP